MQQCPLEVTTQIASIPWLRYLVPQLLRQHGPSSIIEALSMFMTSLPVFVTPTVLVSALIDVSVTIPIDSRLYKTKDEDFGNRQIGTPKTHNILVHRFPHAQFTPHDACFDFDSGGSISRASTRRHVQTQTEDARQRRPYHHAHRRRFPHLLYSQRSRRFQR